MEIKKTAIAAPKTTPVEAKATAPAKTVAPAKATTTKAAAPKKAAAKPAAKKAPAKKAPAKKTEVKATVNFQFAGKSYTTDDLTAIAKDVWKFDLNKKEADFKKVELYVKPEENQAYYVINDEYTGSFFI